MEKALLLILKVLGAVGRVLFLAIFMAFPVKWTWNYVMPYLFELKATNWGQAWCLTFLASCLVKSTQTNNK